MEQPADERCPRCGGNFHCGAGDAGPCPCTTVALDRPTAQSLRERYAGCLCLRCLAELATAASVRAARIDGGPG